VVKRCILLSCPCPHVRSLPWLRLSAPLSPLTERVGARCAPTRCHHRGVSAAPSSTEAADVIDVMLFAFLEFSGPSTFHCSRSDSRSSKALASLSRTLGLPPQLRGALGVSHPLDASFRNLPSGLVSCRYRPWASILRRFLPDRSPQSLSALGVLRVVPPLARPRLRGCQHRSDALPSLRVISAHDARSSLGRSPLRGIDLHGLASRFREAPLLGFSVLRCFVTRSHC
jgi:hypothetical protein